MHKKIQALWSLRHEKLIQGSLWLTVGGMIANIGNFLFNLVMGRLLSPDEYGTLMALLSLSIIISLPSAIITTVITKFTADFSTKNEPEKIARMLRKFTEITCYGGFIIIVLFFVFNSSIQKFLNINSSELVLLTGIMIGVGLITSTNQGVYRGLLLFKALSLLGLLAVLVKLVVGWILVNNNMAVFGALFAIFLSTLIPWLVSFSPIIKYIKIPAPNAMGIRKRIFAFSFPTFAITAASTFYLNADLLLVKHYFSPHDAGIYAAAAIMGKAIFYVLGPISVVLFSLVAQHFAVKKNAQKELSLSLTITVFGGLCALVVYFLFPDFIVQLFFPSNDYLLTNHYIFAYGVYMFLYSLVFLLLNYFLATEKNNASYWGLGFSILQILMIILFHDSLTTVINVSIISVGLLTLLLGSMLLPMRTRS